MQHAAAGNVLRSGTGHDLEQETVGFSREWLEGVSI